MLGYTKRQLTKLTFMDITHPEDLEMDMELTEKVLLLLEDNELRKRISRNTKEKVKVYSWESIVSRLEELYQSLLS